MVAVPRPAGAPAGSLRLAGLGAAMLVVLLGASWTAQAVDLATGEVETHGATLVRRDGPPGAAHVRVRVGDSHGTRVIRAPALYRLLGERRGVAAYVDKTVRLHRVVTV